MKEETEKAILVSPTYTSQLTNQQAAVKSRGFPFSILIKKKLLLCITIYPPAWSVVTIIIKPMSFNNFEASVDPSFLKKLV